MKRPLVIAVVVALLATGLSHPAIALDAATQQHIAELQAQIAALEQEAQQYRDGIAVQQDKAASLQRDINILQGQINQLQTQINATTKKIDLTTTQLGQTQDQIASASADIDQKQATIGRTLLFFDQYDKQDLIASLLQYKNLGEFLTQFNDLSRLQDRLLAAIGDLKDSKATLEDAQTQLQEQQGQLQDLSNQQNQQQTQLSGVKGQKAKVLKDTKGQEAIYQKQLTAVEKKQAAFFQEAQKLEAQAIAGGLFIVHITANPVPPKGTKIFIMPEDHPHLTQGYGMTAYAKRGAYGGLPHSGIDWASGYGTPIKAIGNGTIIAHGTNDGWGNWIAIQHPNNMVSLYGHMSRFENLPVGTPVTQGQVIGYEGDTGNATGSHVHLSIYKDYFTYVNDKSGQLYFNYFDGTVNPLDYIQQ